MIGEQQAKNREFLAQPIAGGGEAGTKTLAGVQ